MALARWLIGNSGPFYPTTSRYITEREASITQHSYYAHGIRGDSFNQQLSGDELTVREKIKAKDKQTGQNALHVVFSNKMHDIAEQKNFYSCDFSKVTAWDSKFDVALGLSWLYGCGVHYQHQSLCSQCTARNQTYEDFKSQNPGLKQKLLAEHKALRVDLSTVINREIKAIVGSIFSIAT
jgi:hypothetical protein